MVCIMAIVQDEIQALTTVYHRWCDGLPPRIGILGAVEFGARLINNFPSNRVLSCSNIYIDTQITPGERSMMQAAGFQAYLALPIFKGNNWIGVLIFQSKSPRIWSDNDVKALKLAAHALLDS
jgi:GAF domain-containing protein